MDNTDAVTIIRAKVKLIELEDVEINLALDEIKQVILNYCNLQELPDALLYTWCNMAIDLLMYTNETNTEVDSLYDTIDPSDVSTISIGDTTITLGDKYRNNARSRRLQSHTANLDTITTNYKAQLNRFRRMW